MLMRDHVPSVKSSLVRSPSSPDAVDEPPLLQRAGADGACTNVSASQERCADRCGDWSPVFSMGVEDRAAVATV